MRDRGRSLRGIRLDSGDLAELARRARALLDEAGLADVQIFASGGLDEIDLSKLVAQGAPIDAFGVGTDLVVSMDRPAVDIAYKLVCYDGRPVAKHSTAKETLPGSKQVFRKRGPQTDVLALRDEALDGEKLLGPVWRDGEVLRDLSLHGARERAQRQVDALPRSWKSIRARTKPRRPALSAGLAAIGRRPTDVT
jgi:nicotinate phosphoribosyltransferase